jgi:uncharacterized protein (DUF305 family)
MGAVLAVSTAGLANAADSQSEHEQHTATTSTTASAGGSKELQDTMMKGMEKMHGMKTTGDTDHDFASMMISHHEQAIAMSKAELKHGKNAATQKTAREIIAASEKDIAELKKQLQSH